MRQIARSRRLALTGVALVGALMLTACTSSSGSSESTSSAGAASSAGSPPSSGAPTAAPSSAGPAPSAAACTTPTPVRLQLPGLTQAQFAGYYAAKDKGIYRDQCLDVSIIEGGGDVVAQTVLEQGGADFAIAWVSKALSSREQGALITNVAQVFQRSGTLEVSWADANIKTAADFKGKRIGSWGSGDEFEVLAAISKAGLDPAADLELVQQPLDMTGLLSKQLDAAEAMSYDQYAQLLETKNPATGKLYQESDFNSVSYETEGVGMLQDAIWANQGKLTNDAAYQDLTRRFVQASLQGWIYCRDNAQGCADIVAKNGSKLGASHQLWMMNEVNKLIWPSPLGVGVMDPAKWTQTTTISMNTKNLDGSSVITREPDPAAYTDAYAKAADTELQAAGLNTTGDGFAPIAVTLNEGGN